MKYRKPNKNPDKGRHRRPSRRRTKGDTRPDVDDSSERFVPRRAGSIGEQAISRRGRP